MIECWSSDRLIVSSLLSPFDSCFALPSNSLVFRSHAAFTSAFHISSISLLIYTSYSSIFDATDRRSLRIRSAIASNSTSVRLAIPWRNDDDDCIRLDHPRIDSSSTEHPRRYPHPTRFAITERSISPALTRWYLHPHHPPRIVAHSHTLACIHAPSLPYPRSYITILRSRSSSISRLCRRSDPWRDHLGSIETVARTSHRWMFEPIERIVDQFRSNERIVTYSNH